MESVMFTQESIPNKANELEAIANVIIEAGHGSEFKDLVKKNGYRKGIEIIKSLHPGLNL